MAFVGILSQVKLVFGQLITQLVWYILKQLLLFSRYRGNSKGYQISYIGATSALFVRLEKSSLNFSSSSFVIRVNLLLP